MKENIYLKAMENKEAISFFLGKHDFFIPEPGTGEHWVLGAWKYHLLPTLNKFQINDIAQSFNEYLYYILTCENDVYAVENLIYNLHVYFYLFKSGEFPTNKLFDIDMEKKLADYILSNFTLSGNWIIDSIKTIYKNSGNELFSELIEKLEK